MSPRLFGDFVAPATDELAESFDTSVIHVHPSTCIPLDYLPASPLSSVELHIDSGGPAAADPYSRYRKSGLAAWYLVAELLAGPPQVRDLGFGGPAGIVHGPISSHRPGTIEAGVVVPGGGASALQYGLFASP